MTIYNLADGWMKLLTLLMIMHVLNTAGNAGLVVNIALLIIGGFWFSYPLYLSLRSIKNWGKNELKS